MTEIVKGFIAKINARNVNTRRGPSTSYSLRLEREDGTEIDKWFSFGFKKPPVNEGDFVKLTYTENDRGFLDVDELKPLKNGPARSQKESPARGASGGGASGARSADPKGPTIHYQNSRTAAIDVVALMLANDALPITEAKTKAGTAKRYEEILALINKITVQFFFDVETLRLTKSVTDAGAVAKDPGKLPNDGDDDHDGEHSEPTDDDDDQD
jgi:hypothetical protein